MHRLRSLAGSLLSLHIPSSQIASADVNENAFIPECREPVDELRVMRSLRPFAPEKLSIVARSSGSGCAGQAGRGETRGTRSGFAESTDNTIKGGSTERRGTID
jgi:hypothetical protein